MYESDLIETPVEAALPPDGSGAEAGVDVSLPHEYQVLDRTVTVRLVVKSPRIILLDGFLSDDECEEVKRITTPLLTRSTVVAERGGSVVSDVRTSMSASLKPEQTPLVLRVEQRIEDLTGIPRAHGEPIEVLRYALQQEYQPHFDFFDPAVEGETRQMGAGGQRVATVIMYLSDVRAGGETAFPRLGIELTPKKGSALFFSYATSPTDTDYRSLHAGRPVLSGDKWIATKWLRQFPYVS